MKSEITFNAPIFDTTKLRDAGSRAVMIAARELRDRTKQNFLDGPQTGRLYARRGGEGFRRFHRASARGERPAVDTGRLLNSVEANRLGDTTAEVVASVPYASFLQDGLDRPILSEQDEKQAEAELARIYEAELRKR